MHLPTLLTLSLAALATAHGVVAGANINGKNFRDARPGFVARRDASISAALVSTHPSDARRDNKFEDESHPSNARIETGILKPGHPRRTRGEQDGGDDDDDDDDVQLNNARIETGILKPTQPRGREVEGRDARIETGILKPGMVIGKHPRGLGVGAVVNEGEE